jgi:hypothetical protein
MAPGTERLDKPVNGREAIIGCRLIVPTAMLARLARQLERDPNMLDCAEAYELTVQH